MQWSNNIIPESTLRKIKMELTKDQYECIVSFLPVQRGNAHLKLASVRCHILYAAEHGCKWRKLLSRFGRWHTFRIRINFRSKSGGLDRVFEHSRKERFVRIRLEAVSMDSTIVTAHLDGTSARKGCPQAADKSCEGSTTKLRLVTEDARTAEFEDFRGQGPRGRPLLRRRPDGPSGGGPERPEPQRRELLPPRTGPQGHEALYCSWRR